MSKSVERRVASQLGHTRNSEVLASFVAYCRAYPELRFWQALRNWSGYNFVLVSNRHPNDTDGPARILDSFHFEGRHE